MQQPARVESPDCGYDTPTTTRSRRAKAAVAGVSMVSAGALALTPVVATPKLPDTTIEARSSAVALSASAFDSAVTPYSQLLQNLYGEIVAGRSVDERVTDPESETGYDWVAKWQTSLISNVSNASNNLVQALADPTVHTGFANAVQNLGDPERLLGVLGKLPEYAERLTASGDLGGDFLQNAITTLLFGDDEQDGALPRTLALLSEGKFFAAFSEINYWFLVEGLSAGRQSQIDGGVLSLPGDILRDLGLEPLANIIGHSQMTDYEVNGKALTNNDGLLGRTVIGNLGRALMAPPITAIFQTMEILDDVQKFVRDEDYDLAIAELVAAPAKITGAFLVGYVPGPLKDFSMEAGRGQAFPGIFSPTGPLDFAFNQIPNEIVKGLRAQKIQPEEDPEDEAEGADLSPSAATLASVTDTNVGRKSVIVDVDVPAAAETIDNTDAGTDELPVEETAADDSAAGDANDEAKALTTRDRLKQVREQSAEKRAERAEKARASVDRVRSNIRKGLGISDKSKSSDSDSKGAGPSDSDSKSDSDSDSKSDSKSKSKDSGSDSGSDD